MYTILVPIPNLKQLIYFLKSHIWVDNYSMENLFEIGDDDTVWDAWFTTVTLLDMLEHTQQIHRYYDFDQARSRIGKIYALAEAHAIDKGTTPRCSCNLSDGEHALLKRKMIKFFKLQVGNLKHFLG